MVSFVVIEQIIHGQTSDQGHQVERIQPIVHSLEWDEKNEEHALFLTVKFEIGVTKREWVIG